MALTSPEASRSLRRRNDLPLRSVAASLSRSDENTSGHHAAFGKLRDEDLLRGAPVAVLSVMSLLGSPLA